MTLKDCGFRLVHNKGWVDSWDYYSPDAVVGNSLLMIAHIDAGDGKWVLDYWPITGRGCERFDTEEEVAARAVALLLTGVLR